jgi:hypothetical protein
MTGWSRRRSPVRLAGGLGLSGGLLVLRSRRLGWFSRHAVAEAQQTSVVNLPTMPWSQIDEEYPAFLG